MKIKIILCHYVIYIKGRLIYFRNLKKKISIVIFFFLKNLTISIINPKLCFTFGQHSIAASITFGHLSLWGSQTGWKLNGEQL